MKVTCALIECSTNTDLLAGKTVGFEVLPCPQCECIHIYLGNDMQAAKYRFDLDLIALQLLASNLVGAVSDLRRLLETGEHDGGVNDNIH